MYDKGYVTTDAAPEQAENCSNATNLVLPAGLRHKRAGFQQ
jgi:hypothetical protein